MRGVLLEVPERMLAERRSLGIDVRDEMWDGVVHMAPPPSEPHQRVGTDLLIAVGALARDRGLRPYYETGLFRADDDYRVPDLLFCRPQDVTHRGAERAELVVEVRSPDDESYAKLDFYASLRVREVLVLHPGDRRAELFRLVGERLLPVSADAEGGVRSEVLGVRFTTRGTSLDLRWDGGSATL